MSLDYVSHVRNESALFGAALRSAEPDARVPTCPEWTADDLLWHLAEVQFFWAAIVRDRLADPTSAQAAKPIRPTHRSELLTFFDQSSAALVDALARAGDDDEAIWTWFPPAQNIGFARRRQAHEALIHRVDAELTAGSAVSALDAALATDGVAEVLEVIRNRSPGWATSELDCAVGTVSTTDTAASWLVQVGHWHGTSPTSGESYRAQPTISIVGSGEPTFTVLGAASDLDLWLWNRPSSGVGCSGQSADFEAVIRGDSR